jgi:hypothetical protein
MVYGPIQGGRYGACRDVYPIPPEGSDLCGDCDQRPRASGDWLCLACRRELNEQLRRAAVATGNPSLVLAWADAEMSRQLAELKSDDDELPF